MSTKPEFDVQRIHIRSTIAGVDHDAATNWCLTEGMVGVGWGVWDERGPRDWARYVGDYETAKGHLDGNVRRLRDLEPGTLIWTRERNGDYWLGQIVGDWEYREDPVARTLDLFNLRETSWEKIGTEDRVPGRVVNAFRSSRTLQRIRDDGATAYTNLLLRRCRGEGGPGEGIDPRVVIDSMLGPEDLEDLVAVYLQDQFDYLVVSRFRSTPGYEYVLRGRKSGQTAVASVKSGETPVDLTLLPTESVDVAYAYAVCDEYEGQGSPKIRCITTSELCDFMRARPSVLPDRIAAWMSR